jgi:hypothetical protein
MVEKWGRRQLYSSLSSRPMSSKQSAWPTAFKFSRQKKFVGLKYYYTMANNIPIIKIFFTTADMYFFLSCKRCNQINFISEIGRSLITNFTSSFLHSERLDRRASEEKVSWFKVRVFQNGLVNKELARPKRWWICCVQLIILCIYHLYWIARSHMEFAICCSLSNCIFFLPTHCAVLY